MGEEIHEQNAARWRWLAQSQDRVELLRRAILDVPAGFTPGEVVDVLMASPATVDSLPDDWWAARAMTRVDGDRTLNPDIRPLTLPAPATSGHAHPDPLWSAERLRSLEGQRRAYADEVMMADDICYQQDMTIRRQGDEIARLRDELMHANRAIVDLSEENDVRGKTMLRLRAHLAAAGLALDALTAQLAEHRAVGDRLAAGMAMGAPAGGCEGCDCCDPEAARR